MSVPETVNLRAANSNPPENGELIAEVTLPSPWVWGDPTNQRYPDDEPKLLLWKGRLFMFAKGTFAYGGAVTAEYVEIVPLSVDANV
jgi:hypothetical protein